MPEHNHLGCRLHYRLSGGGPPILMIQGVGVHGDGWQPQVEYLLSNCQCLTFDNRGLGLSQPVGENFSLKQFADDALSLMDAAGWQSAHVIGHSMGGLISQHLALTAPHRVRSLSLLCTFSRGKDVTALTWEMTVYGIRTRLGPAAWRRQAFLEMITAPGSIAQPEQDALIARMTKLFGHDLAHQPPIVMKQLSAMSDYDATPRLGELSGIPTLVVSGAYDRIARPALGRALAAAIPHSSYTEFEDAGHALPITHASRLNPLLLNHISETS